MKAKAREPKEREPKERAPVVRAAYLAPESVREVLGNALQILTAQLTVTRGDNDYAVMHDVARLLTSALAKLDGREAAHPQGDH